MSLSAIVAGSRSGCGKTTATLSLMAALARRGLVVQGCKSGPDFIDPGYHKLITGRPSFNLDSWMAGEAGVLRSFARAASSLPDVLLIEGAMALFDGSGVGISGSTAHLAELLDAPVIMLLDVKGVGQSVAALAKGFTELRPNLEFAGLICTHAGGAAHGDIIREALANSAVPLLGILPRKGAPCLKSRHLGLLMAEEHEDTGDFAAEAALWFEENVDVDLLLARLKKHGRRNSPRGPSGSFSVAANAGGRAWGLKPGHVASFSLSPSSGLAPCALPVGIALDEAFCFMYPDLPEILLELGVETRFFSPLRDAAPPPECSVLIFPGGYPELHAHRLSRNKSMLEAVRGFAASGGRVYGECGGYMYLGQSLEADGAVFAMSGCLPLDFRFEGRLAALGYREARPFSACCFGKESISGRGHEYHYSTIKNAPSGLPPLWRVFDRLGRELRPEGARLGATCGSWVHLFPEGALDLWKNFLGSEK